MRSLFGGAVCVCLLSMVLVCGCQNQLSNKLFLDNGMPARQYLVGGGYNVEYTARTDGVLYWVNEPTCKILATKSLSKDETAQFSCDDITRFKKILGMDVEKATLSLYFIPDGEK